MVESIPLDLLTYPTKNPLIVLRSSFFSYELQTLTSDEHSQTRICHKLSFHHFHNSNGVFGITLVGTHFNIYIVLLRALVHKDLGSLKLLSILRTMFNNIRFLFFAMPF